MYFEVKVQFRGTDSNGKEKMITETFLIDAVTFGDAEKKAYEQKDGYGEVSVKAIKISRIGEVFLAPDSDKEGTFYECTTQFATTDENSGKIKVVKAVSLVEADDNDAASVALKKEMVGMMFDYDIIKIAFSPICAIA